MKEISIESLQEELNRVTTDYSKHYDREQAKSSILNDIALLYYYSLKDEKQALSYWEQSLQVFPYLHERNMEVSLIMLKDKKWEQANRFLTQYLHSWIHLPGQGEKLVRTKTIRVQHEIAKAEENGTIKDLVIENRLIAPAWYSREYYDVPIAKSLAEILEKENIADYPNLIGGYYFLLRNTLKYFDIDPKGLGFAKEHLPKVEAFARKYENNSLLWAVVGNTYFLDLKDNQKAFEAYSKAIKYAEVSTYIDFDRFLRSAIGSNNSFDEALLLLKEKTPNLSAAICYDIRGDLDTIKDEQIEAGKKWKDLYWESEIFFAHAAWEKLGKYIVEGDIFDPSMNQPHIFAMACNNYACSLENYSIRDSDEVNVETTKQVISLRKMGFSVSPFWENLRPLILHYADLEQYDECLKLRPIVEEYIDYINDAYEENQAYSRFMLSAHVLHKSLSLDKIHDIYRKAKELFIKNRGKDDEYPERADGFFVNSLRMYIAILTVNKGYEAVEKEFLWAQENGIIELNEGETGDLLHYFALASHLLGKDQQALTAYNRAIPYFCKSSEDAETLASINKGISEIENRIYTNRWQKFRRGFLPRFINVLSSYSPKRSNKYNLVMIVTGMALFYYASTGKMNMTMGYIGGVLMLASGVFNLFKK